MLSEVLDLFNVNHYSILEENRTLKLEGGKKYKIFLGHRSILEIARDTKKIMYWLDSCMPEEFCPPEEITVKKFISILMEKGHIQENFTKAKK